MVTDASDYAIGGVLEHRLEGQKEPLPLAFASKTLEDSRTRYCATKKELYAIVFFMRYFLGFYRGTKVWIETDHYALQWLMGFNLTDPMYLRWVVEMGQYQPWEITHRAGKDNVAADALSRKNKPDPKRSKKPYRSCNIPHCEVCKFHFRKNRKCRDSDSESEGDDDDDESDRPDAGDMSLWEMMLTRCHNYRNVRMVFAVTRGGARELEKQRSKDQPPRRSQRVAAQREARKIAAKNEPKPDLLRPVRKHWKRKHRDKVRKAQHQSKRRYERHSARRDDKRSEDESGYSSGASGKSSGEECPVPEVT